MGSFRKAYRALKDSTTLGLANLYSEFKDLDIAIVKATNHHECPPKDHYLQRIIAVVSIHRPRADATYCIHALARRLYKTHNWIVALKTLIVLHRTLREGHPAFREELLQYTLRGRLFQISNFKDESSPVAWDCSNWIRSYGLYLEEKIECMRILKYDIDTEKVPKSAPRQSKVYSRTRHLNTEQLLQQLPALQQLLHRLICCQPEGAACCNYLIQYALALVLKESFNIYCSINDGIINLVDKFFEMPKHNAFMVLDIYKKAGKQAERLAEFYNLCKTLDLARTFQFPILRQPPRRFLATMEDYIKEAPQISSLSQQRLEYHEVESEPEEPEYPSLEEHQKPEEPKNKEKAKPEPDIKEEATQPAEEPTDLLGLREINPQALQMEESNALAVAILQPGSKPTPASNTLIEIEKTSGWELAVLKMMPCNTNKPQVADPKLAGGFNKLLLDSLYADDTARRALQMRTAVPAGYSMSYLPNQESMQNPFNQQNSINSFTMSSNYVPPMNMQMAMMLYQQKQMMGMVPYNMYVGQYPSQQMLVVVPSDPIGDPFSLPQNALSSPPSYRSNALI